MVQRREPTISGMSALKEEEVNRSGANSAPSKPSSSARASSNRGEPAQAQTRSTRSSNVAPPQKVIVKNRFTPVLWLFVIVTAGFAGFSYYQLYEAQALLNQAESRISDLEGRLELTGDESEASMAAVQAKLKWADSEIRKLWGVSYDRNRKSIADNGEKLTSLIGQINRLKKDLPNAVEQQMGDVTGELALLNELVTANQAVASSADQKAREQVSQLQKLNDQLGQLRSTSNTLERNVKTNTQDIEAINAFRRTVNQQILELKAKP